MSPTELFKADNGASFMSDGSIVFPRDGNPEDRYTWEESAGVVWWVSETGSRGMLPSSVQEAYHRYQLSLTKRKSHLAVARNGGSNGYAGEREAGSEDDHNDHKGGR